MTSVTVGSVALAVPSSAFSSVSKPSPHGAPLSRLRALVTGDPQEAATITTRRELRRRHHAIEIVPSKEW